MSRKLTVPELKHMITTRAKQLIKLYIDADHTAGIAAAQALISATQSLPDLDGVTHVGYPDGMWQLTDGTFVTEAEYKRLEAEEMANYVEEA
jgi:hypothetical protein